MTLITLYKTTITRSYMADECGEGYSFRPWSDGGCYTGRDDGGNEYQLPEGFTLGKNSAGDEMIFDDADRYCAITIHPASGLPHLICPDMSCHVLRMVEPRDLHPGT